VRESVREREGEGKIKQSSRNSYKFTCSQTARKSTPQPHTVVLFVPVCARHLAGRN
jgi:hypothetical protein